MLWVKHMWTNSCLMLLPPYEDKVNICNKIVVGLDEKKVDTVFANNFYCSMYQCICRYNSGQWQIFSIWINITNGNKTINIGRIVPIQNTCISEMTNYICRADINAIAIKVKSCSSKSSFVSLITIFMASSLTLPQCCYKGQSVMWWL